MRIDGCIRPVDGITPFDRRAWCDVVARHSEFRRPAPREITNPFTKKPATVQPPQGAAEVWLDGNLVGNVSWSMSAEPLVNVSVEPPAIPLVHQWAAELGGVFETNAASGGG